jgi:S-layer protein (TIGR01567 family)
MTKLTTTVVVALMIMALTIMSASAATSVEIRGTVFDANSPSYFMDATNFAGFYYDLDDDISTESMDITTSLTNTSRTIAARGLWYNTSIDSVDYASGNLPGQYNVMGLFAEKYVPLANDTPDKLSKLLLDADQKYTLRTGTALQLPGGYALTAKQIDVDGNKVWIEFTKDGEFIEDEILDMNTNKIWTYEVDDIAGEDDVVVMRVAITNVFQGQVDSLAVVDGIWLMDYENVLELETEDKFDKLELVTIGERTLSFNNPNSIALTKDKTISVAQGMSFKVANSDALRFYLMKVFTAPGTYEIRGEVVTTGAQSWDATSFAGFYYDIDDDISTESLAMTTSLTNASRTIAARGLWYNTSIDSVDYASGNLPGQYNVMGLFAEKYIPLADDTPEKLSKLLLDSDSKYTLRTGTALQLPGGYALTAKQIDVDGNKVWMEFTKDGEFVEDEILDVSNGTVVWTYEADDIAGEDDVVVMRVAVTNVFQGQVDSLAVIDGVWLMDYENVLELETEDKFDKLELVTIGGTTLSFNNPNSIALTKDKTISITQGISFKVANSDSLRYYPFATLTIEGDDVTQPDPVDPTEPTEPSEPSEPGVPGEPSEPTEPSEPGEPSEPTPEEESPGFEAIFAIAGLLAVAYLVRRN